MSHPCHLCGSDVLTHVPGFEDVARVTSDCKPWPPGGRLYFCNDCGLVQKNTDPFWQDEMERIYANYTIYHQSEGEEQPVMVDEGGGLLSRSRLLLERLREAVDLPAAGRLLDVGCGNGGFLKTCSRALPSWRLVGTEFDAKYKEMVERIPGVELMHSGQLEDLPGEFEVISMLHVLEHIPWPTQVMTAIRGKLAAGGLLLLNLPDFRLNPFELVVADHCTHFQELSVEGFLERHGFEVLINATDWIRKERVVVARVGPRGTGERPLQAEVEIRHLRASVDFLRSVIAAAARLRRRESLGVFGTSIAGTWLAGAIEGRFDFFVEEDPTRIGRPHMGKPILSPDEVQAGSTVLIALSREISGLLKDRYLEKRPDVDWLVETDPL